MPHNAKPVTVGTSAVKIVELAKNRTSYIVCNNGSATVYVGGNVEVTTTNGYPIYAGDSVEFSPAYGDDVTLELYGVSGTAGQDVRVLEEYA